MRIFSIHDMSMQGKERNVVNRMNGILRSRSDAHVTCDMASSEHSRIRTLPTIAVQASYIVTRIKGRKWMDL